MSAGRSNFGPYRIVAPLGAGAMGEVYRAHDPRLRRDVAIKILPPHRSDDPDAVARMIRESQMVAALAHPAIVTIHDVGEEDGRFYFVTELLDGETLRDRLRRGPLPIREAIECAATIGAAIAAAHSHGIVHRDLKPENIMCAAGGLKVLDFGVAKFFAPTDAETAAPPTFVTEGHHAIGTPAYMAPEQLEGRAIDHRADQFAFGVMLHEMLAGQRPFKGTTPGEVTAAILRDEPVSLSGIRADLPAPLARIVARCLHKDPNQRYASTTDLARALTDVGADLSVLSDAAAPPKRGRSWMPLGALALLTAIATGVAIVAWPKERATPSADSARRGAPAVAVLPFTTIGNAEPYLADGITEAVTRELGHIEGARVIASNTAFAYRGRTDDGGRIGRELGVDVMVRGSVQRAGERLSINATLVNAVDNTTLWGNHYDRAAADILAVQDDIAWQVAAKLAATLGTAAPARPAATPKTSPDAYDAYLRGISHMRNSVRMADAIRELKRAVTLDPNFALARAKLASAYTQQFFYNSPDPALEREAFIELQRALAINPDLAEAYLARAQLTWNLRNGFPHERAIADLRRAIDDNPSLADAHVELGKVYVHIGLIDKSIAANQEALRLDPQAAAARQRLVAAQIDGGRTQELADALARNPQWWPRTRATALAFLDRPTEAIDTLIPRAAGTAELRKLEMNEAAILAALFARQKRGADAKRALALAIPLAANPTGLSDTHHAQFAIGCAYALLGERDKALEWITKAANEGYPSYPRFSTERDLAGLKGHPGFEALLARLQKDYERWQTSL